MMNYINFILILLALQSCQHFDKSRISDEHLNSAKLTSQFKIHSPEQNKSLSAKAIWYVQRPELLRLDILGPFDLLLAQAYRVENKLVVIDHRKKIATHFNTEKPILVDQIELPLTELHALLLQPQPKGWKCNSETSNQTCQKGDLISSWPEPNQLKLQHPKFDFSLTIKEKIENPTFDSKTFKINLPSSYTSNP